MSGFAVDLGRRGDIARGRTGCLRDDGFMDGYVNSLFLDARLPDDVPLPDGAADRRGCWMDAISDHPAGSLLWTLHRRVADQATLLEARGIIAKALAWMVKSAVPPFRDVAGIEVVAAWGTPRGRLDVVTRFHMRGGTVREVAFEYGLADAGYLIKGLF